MTKPILDPQLSDLLVKLGRPGAKLLRRQNGLTVECPASASRPTIHTDVVAAAQRAGLLVSAPVQN